jgi:hypothetical protein
MLSGNVSLSVLVHGRDGGRGIPAPEYVSPVNRDTYIEGREGSNFSLRIHNGTHRRVLAIPSVDGLGALDGKPAGMESRGFIMAPGETVDVPGWMLDQASVARFVFSGTKDGVDQSYVAQIGGDVRHKGTIGVLVLDENRPKPFHGGLTASSAGSASKGVLRSAPMAAMSMNAAPEAAMSQSLGTGFGEAAAFHTRSGHFDRGGILTRIDLFYDDARGLKRVGIDVSRPVSPRPSAFPALDMGCAPPPGWRR